MYTSSVTAVPFRECDNKNLVWNWKKNPWVFTFSLGVHVAQNILVL